MILTTGVLLAVLAVAWLVGHRCHLASGKIRGILADELDGRPATVLHPDGNRSAHQPAPASGMVTECGRTDHAEDTGNPRQARHAAARRLSVAGRSGIRLHARRG